MYSSKHAIPIVFASESDKKLCLRIQTLIENPLIFIPPNVIIKLIEKRVVVELVGDKRHDGVDCVVLGGDIVDGCVADEYGEDEADDGCEYLATVGTGLSLLQMEVFEEEGFDLMTGLGLSAGVVHQSENIRIMFNL